MLKKSLYVVVLVALVFTSLFFYTKREKPDYAIQFGTPYGTNNVVESTTFSKPLSDREDIEAVLFTLMRTETIAKPEVVNTLPDAAIWINSWEEGETYFIVNLWIEATQVIVESELYSAQPRYAMLRDQQAATLIHLIEKYKSDLSN